MELTPVPPQFSAPPPPTSSSHVSYGAPRPGAPTILPRAVTVQPVESRKELSLSTGSATDDSSREQNVREAAKHVSGEYFAVSDTIFSIYKDATTGQFVTRFTSLRDGKVTYFPEPDVLAFMERKRRAEREAVLDIRA